MRMDMAQPTKQDGKTASMNSRKWFSLNFKLNKSAVLKNQARATPELGLFLSRLCVTHFFQIFFAARGKKT
jgi:hypothetical protein